MIKKYIPNILTSIRIFLIPIFIFYLLIAENYMMSFIIFTIASITDWADGYFARKFNNISNFGIFFDPLADKLLVLSAFISFLYIDVLIISKSIEVWMIIIIAFRDLSITFLRIIANFKEDIVIVTTNIAKLKTAIQLITINFILLCLIFSNYFNFIYYLMFITTIITLYTGVHYYYYNGKKIFLNLLNK